MLQSLDVTPSHRRGAQPPSNAIRRPANSRASFGEPPAAATSDAAAGEPANVQPGAASRDRLIDIAGDVDLPAPARQRRRLHMPMLPATFTTPALHPVHAPQIWQASQVLTQLRISTLPDARGGSTAAAPAAAQATQQPAPEPLASLFPSGVPAALVLGAVSAAEAIAHVAAGDLRSLGAYLGLPVSMLARLADTARPQLDDQGVPPAQHPHVALIVLTAATYSPVTSLAPAHALPDFARLSGAEAAHLAEAAAQVLRSHHDTLATRSAVSAGPAEAPAPQADTAASASEVEAGPRQRLQNMILSALETQTSPRRRLQVLRSSQRRPPAEPGPQSSGDTPALRDTARREH